MRMGTDTKPLRLLVHSADTASRAAMGRGVSAGLPGAGWCVGRGSGMQPFESPVSRRSLWSRMHPGHCVLTVRLLDCLMFDSHLYLSKS